MNVYYVNHMNERVDFDSDNVILQYQEFFDHSWDAVVKNNKISGFKRDSATIPMTVAIMADNMETYYNVLEKMYNALEVDVLKGKAGRLFVGNYYLKCFVSGDKKQDAFTGAPMQIKNLTVVTDSPFWKRETTTTFGYGELSGGDFDFFYDFSHDYTSNILGKQLFNPNFVDSNFRMNFYGMVDGPVVTIGGHSYGVNVTLEANEYLTLDSVEKTIVLTHVDGTKENVYNKRVRNPYPFQKIPPGTLNVSANGEFKFDIALLEERSEPKWI